MESPADKYQQQHQQQPPAVSITKTLTSLTAVPSNRTCADCHSTLVDASQVYASFSPQLEIPVSRYNQFHFNHMMFKPPGDLVVKSQQQQQQHTATTTTTSSSSILTTAPPPPPPPPIAVDPPVDPSLLATHPLGGGHGVFVCAPCAAAHKLLGPAIAVVRAVQDPVGWTLQDVERLASAGGNDRATAVYEAYLPAKWERKMRPTAESSIADRLTFCRAKYEALAFVLPRTGPLAPRAWRRIVQMHPEWNGLWGADLLSVSDLDIHNSSRLLLRSSSSDDETLPTTFQQQQHRAELPNRLVDYFCVVTASEYMHPQMVTKDLSMLTQSPEDLLLAPQVSDCFPSEDTYDDTEFPQHVSTFVFPEGCHPKATPMPPILFTFVLTTGSGDRLYGACLRLYDDGKDIEVLRQIVKQSGYAGNMPQWLEEASESSKRGTAAAAAATSDVVFFPKCLVILSHYAFFDLWRKFLLQIYRIALVQAPLPVERFIANFVREVPLPPPGNVRIKFGFTVDDPWIIERPPENQLPLANFSYRPLFTCLSVSNAMVVFGCLLQETRVALVSRHYALLCPVAEALLSLLFPFHWQGMYLPILPYSMFEMLDAPVPYLIGLHSRYLTDVPLERRPQGVVFVDLDKDEVHLGFSDGSDRTMLRTTPSFPEKKALKLKAKLDEFASCAYLLPTTGKAGTITTGDGIPLSYDRRDSYAHIHPSEIPLNHGFGYTRKDVFGNVDRAYRDNELLMPINGFLSEHGQLSKRRSLVPTVKNKSSRSLFKKRGGRSSSSDASGGVPPDESLLSLEEPGKFSSAEIREAFLRFFVSLFKNYKQFLTASGFHSEEFIASLNIPDRSEEFVESVLKTQMFHGFVYERQENPDDPEVRFFDESILAKENRSKKVKFRGGKKATEFLNDSTGQIKDTFSPPPPSNWGLPDDGRMYQYASFPNLNQDLFGKIRPPREWPRSYQKRSYRSLRRMSVSATQAKERAVVAKAMAPVVKTHAMLSAATKRGFKSLESALGALSAPFAVPPPAQEDHFPDHVSEVTLGSTLDIGQDLISSAEEVVLNARRKQVILTEIIIKLQACARMYLVKKQRRNLRGSSQEMKNTVENETDAEEAIDSSAIVHIQAYFRGTIARRSLGRVRYAVLSMQARNRGRRVRLAYSLVIHAILRTQAAARRFICRRRVTFVITKRLELYRSCIFTLWKRAHTPLTYRTKFWPLTRGVSFVRLAVVEKELYRLWKELKINTEKLMGAQIFDETMKVAGMLGLSNSCYLSAKKSQEMPLPIFRSRSISKAADREAAERLQIYVRLTMSGFMDANMRTLFVKSFAGTEKLKKVTLAMSIWSSLDDADISAGFMMDMFPELKTSSDILFLEPSKKAIRRINAGNPMPRPLSEDMWAHTRLSTAIRRNVAEVADIALRKVPQLITLCQKESARKAYDDRIRKIAGETVDPIDFRLSLIRHYFLDGKQSKPSSAKSIKLELPGKGFRKDDELKKQKPLENGPQNGAEPRASKTVLPGEGFWEGGKADEIQWCRPSSPRKQKGGAVMNDSFPGKNFWEEDE